MKFHTDSYFAIGAMHLRSGSPCQDYATSAWAPESACAVVADGCSTGGRTDLGARLLALATERAIRIQTAPETTRPRISPERITVGRTHMSETAQVALGLSRSDLLSTCVYVVAQGDRGFFHVAGDGVVAVKFRNGSTSSTRFEWTENAPYYPSYSSADREKFLTVFKSNILTSENVVHSESQPVSDRQRRGYAPEDAMDGITVEINLEEVAVLAVFSDGVTQIGTIPPPKPKIPWDDVVHDLLQMKSLAGEFVTRRVTWGLKDYARDGLVPLDDISCAMIAIDRGEE